MEIKRLYSLSKRIFFSIRSTSRMMDQFSFSFFFQYLNKVVDTREPAFFVIALLPRFGVSHLHVVGQGEGFGEINHPGSDVLPVINDQNAAPDHLKKKTRTNKVGRSIRMNQSSRLIRRRARLTSWL